MTEVNRSFLLDVPETHRRESPPACWRESKMTIAEFNTAAFKKLIAVFAIIAAWATSVATAQLDRRGLIEQALDEPTHITLEDIRLGDAIEKVSEQTGIRVFMPPSVMAFVPYGADTVVRRVEIEGISLRQGLTNLFAPLGMTFRVDADHVVVDPHDALRNLGRAPTWTELDTLAELRGIRPGVDDNDLNRLRGRIRFAVPIPDGWTPLAAAIRSVGSGPGDTVLSLACSHLGWGWSLDGDGITVVSGAGRIQRTLQQPVSLRMNFKPLIDVLQELGRVTGVAIRTEPAVLASLPVQVRENFSINAHNTPAEHILEKIAAYTGLGYLVEADGVLFYDATGAPPQTSGAEPITETPPVNDPYVGKVVTPVGDGRTVEWLVRRSELPPDLRTMRQEDLKEAFEAIRAQKADPKP